MEQQTFVAFSQVHALWYYQSAALTPSLFSLGSLTALRYSDPVRLHGRKDSNMMNVRRSEQDRMMNMRF